jgi:O-antigen ligase
MAIREEGIGRPDTEKRSAWPYPLLAVLLTILATTAVTIAGTARPPYLVLVALILATILAFFEPLVIPITVIAIAPLLGQTSEVTIGLLNATSILGLWFLIIGGLLIIPKLAHVFRSKTIVAQFLLVMLTAVSVLPSVSKLVTMTEALRIAAAAMMLPVAYVLSRQERTRKAITYAILASAIIPISVGLYQKVTGNVGFGHRADVAELATGLQGINATFWDIHPFAKYLLVIAVILFVHAFLGRKLNAERLIAGLLFVSALVALLFTYARSQLIGFVVAAATILYTARKLNLRTLILIGLLLFVLFAATDVFVRFSDLFQALDLETPARVNSLKSRILLWRRGFPLTLNRPILGHGADTFRETMGIVSHNDYLGLFFDFGFLGPILYLLFFWFAARAAWRVSREPGFSLFDRRLGLIVLGLTVTIAMLSVGENMARDTMMWWLYLALLGCMLGAMRSVDGVRGQSAEVTDPP